MWNEQQCVCVCVFSLIRALTHVNGLPAMTRTMRSTTAKGPTGQACPTHARARFGIRPEASERPSSSRLHRRQISSHVTGGSRGRRLMIHGHAGRGGGAPPTCSAAIMRRRPDHTHTSYTEITAPTRRVKESNAKHAGRGGIRLASARCFAFAGSCPRRSKWLLSRLSLSLFGPPRRQVQAGSDAAFVRPSRERETPKAESSLALCVAWSIVSLDDAWVDPPAGGPGRTAIRA